MRILIAEDDFVTRFILTKILSHYGSCDVAVDGNEALCAFQIAIDEKAPYDLVCLDIMMPQVNGQQVLRQIREREEQNGVGGLDSVKIIMITALHDASNVISAFRGGCEAYVTKPIDRQKLLGEMRKLSLIE